MTTLEYRVFNKLIVTAQGLSVVMSIWVRLLRMF